MGVIRHYMTGTDVEIAPTTDPADSDSAGVMDVETPGFPITTGLHLNTNAGLQSDTENRPPAFGYRRPRRPGRPTECDPQRGANP